jgi:hypothetical protein
MKKVFFIFLGFVFGIILLSSCRKCSECTATSISTGKSYSGKECGSSDKLQKFVDDWERQYGGGGYNWECTTTH